MWRQSTVAVRVVVTWSRKEQVVAGVRPPRGGAVGAAPRRARDQLHPMLLPQFRHL